MGSPSTGAVSRDSLRPLAQKKTERERERERKMLRDARPTPPIHRPSVLADTHPHTPTPTHTHTPTHPHTHTPSPSVPSLPPIARPDVLLKTVFMIIIIFFFLREFTADRSSAFFTVDRRLVLWLLFGRIVCLFVCLFVCFFHFNLELMVVFLGSSGYSGDTSLFGFYLGGTQFVTWLSRALPLLV